MLASPVGEGFSTYNALLWRILWLLSLAVNARGHAHHRAPREASGFANRFLLCYDANIEQDRHAGELSRGAAARPLSS